MRPAVRLAATFGLISVGLIAGLAFERPASAQTISAAQGAAIDAVAGRQLAAQHLPGLSVAVERDGRIVYAKGMVSNPD